MCKAGKGYYYMQKADIERRRWGKKDILRLTGYRLGFLILLRFFGLFTFLLKHFPLLSLSIRYALDRQTDLRVALGLLASPRPGGESDEKGRQAGGLGP